jgi:phosphomannomutase/phosphoglucomutase
MLSSKRLFGTNGIRGVVNKELTVETAIRIGTAIGTFFKSGELIVGYDARTSGPVLAKAVVSSLNATGCDVLFAGMAPTPALQHAVKIQKADGAVIITASHNPPEYNGIKVVWKDGIELSREQETRIESIFFKEDIHYREWNNLGTTRNLYGVIDDYTEAIKKHVNALEIKKNQYHIVIDPANSVGSLAAPRLFRELGCKVTTINANIDGTFPGRLPEPRPENLKDLAITVKAVGADLGVAYDGDADRAIFVDENGEVHWGDKTFALVEKHFLKNNPDEKIVTPVSSSSLIKDIADSHNGEIIWTKVGSIIVSQTMKEEKSRLGGEENGGIFYGPHQPVRDGAMATALILGVMADTKKKLSALLGGLPKYFLEKGKVDCPNKLKDRVLEKLRQKVSGLETNAIDGIKVWFEDRSAVLMRPSGTEPIYRIYAEAKTGRRASELVQKYGSTLEKLIDDLKG